MQKKLIVFDINDTLITKILKNDTKRLNSLSKYQKNNLVSYNKFFLLKRPNTEVLVNFLNEHMLDYIFWSTSMKHNLEKMIPYLIDIGYNYFLGYLSQENCDEDHITKNIKTIKNIKNLKEAARVYKRKTKDIILVDNSIEKHIPGQNFIHVTNINFQEDFEIFYICKNLDKFIGCQDIHCSVKRMY